ncbi:transcriptional regulator, ArsR family [Aeromicrobium marinum DSM 15272]|uniref:Transcriptional regulator, ArsR family n=1 Tax=Aeromicrobium marinum DSM 15272 TaxID=585531 RepID=E2SCB3_9ACTN|nr:metalloregulator ArsR/SmtB family transcription factor [Aeromicrobium marinum]EFQ82866.1 transcriptional regulator, ArsR family [Aeromicrobium marinum DSM 15272]
MADPTSSPDGPSLDHATPPDPTRLHHASHLFALLSDTTRLHLLWHLGDGPATVTELVDRTGAPRTGVSQHLARLRRAGLVDVTRSGRFQHYSLRGGHVARLVREGLNHADHLITGEDPHD